MRTSALFVLLCAVCRAHFGRSYMNVFQRNEGSEISQPSNLGCFLCTQLLSVTKHRVGLSQNQLRSVLYEKCRMLPAVFKEQCFTFVESSLPEIYFSLNYDFSTKDVCVRLNLCDENNPFAVGGPIPDKIIRATDRPFIAKGEKELEQLETLTEERAEKPEELDRQELRPQALKPRDITDNIEKDRATLGEIPPVTEGPEMPDRIGHKNVIPDNTFSEAKQLTCAFCERMLENAKNYAVTSKADITAFASSACARLGKGPPAEQCYQLADKKIAELAKFVDDQVVEALWCAEINQC